eukprot:PITA_35348
MVSNGKIEIEKFNGQSFELWKLKMEDLLVDKDQWIAVDPGEVMTKALWDKLGTLYQYKSLVNKLFLRKKLYNLRMKDGDSVTKHLNAFNTAVSQLASVDIKISDEDKCISLLCSLPDSWDSLVIAIGSNATTLHFDEIVSSLLTEEMRWKNMESQNGDALSGVWTGTLYKLQGSTVVDGCNNFVVPESGEENLVVSGEKTMLRNQGLGHIREKGLRILHGKGMVEEFKALVENETEKKIKVLRIDNGGELCSKEFEEFCKKCGIVGQKTTPYTPQQNGVAEIMNKTLMERERSMLSGVGLGQEFWVEAVDTTCYLVNRSPSSAFEDKTQREVWTGKKPSLSHMKVFGCDAYVHVPKEKRSKLDSKSKKYIFIGYKDGLKGYKLWNIVTRKVVYSIYVVFREVKDVIKHEVQ